MAFEWCRYDARCWLSLPNGCDHISKPGEPRQKGRASAICTAPFTCQFWLCICLFGLLTSISSAAARCPVDHSTGWRFQAYKYSPLLQCTYYSAPGTLSTTQRPSLNMRKQMRCGHASLPHSSLISQPYCTLSSFKPRLPSLAGMIALQWFSGAHLPPARQINRCERGRSKDLQC